MSDHPGTKTHRRSQSDGGVLSRTTLPEEGAEGAETPAPLSPAKWDEGDELSDGEEDGTGETRQQVCVDL